jgi:DNA-binding MarR family transcriptional regulator
MTNRNLRLDDFLPYRLSVTSNLVSDRIAQSYRALFGLTIPEWRMIAVLAEHAGITQQDIGTRTRMDKVTISRAAIALTARTLIVRAPNPADGRSHCLSLTASGSDLYARIGPKALAMEREIFGSFAPERLKAFEATLRDVEARVTALTG